MASIAGSQGVATAPGQPVNVSYTSDGSGLATVPGAFNLEVWTGPNPPTVPGAGFDGLVVLSNGGNQLDLYGTGFEIQDTGSGTHSIIAHGDNETISAGPNNNDLLIAYGTGDVIIGGGTDTIDVFGNNDTVN